MRTEPCFIILEDDQQKGLCVWHEAETLDVALMIAYNDRKQTLVAIVEIDRFMNCKTIYNSIQLDDYIADQEARDEANRRAELSDDERHDEDMLSYYENERDAA